MIFPTGDYFLPFMLTEIASTMIYALCLYRAKPSATRVIIARFLICFLVNVVLQQLIFAWQYTYMGNPDKAKESIMGIMTTARIFKNLFFFPIETVVITLFLKVLIPVTQRVGLTYGKEVNMGFNKKQVAALLLLVVVGIGSAVGYLTYRYNSTSRSADYTAAQRVDANKTMTQLVVDKTDDWDDETVICIVDSAFRPMFDDTTDYTISVYILDQDAFEAGQAADPDYTIDTLFGYSKSGPNKDPHKSMIKVATVKVEYNEDSDEVLSFDVKAIQ